MTTKKICLLWHNLESGNLGVSALSVGQILILEEISLENNIKFEYTTVGTVAESSITTREHFLKELGINVTHIDYILSLSIIREIIKGLIFGNGIFAKFDYVIDIGEGDSFSDIYGFKRFFWHFISKLHVIRCGTPLILAPQTYGPYNGFVSNSLAKYVFQKAHSIFSRDQKSKLLVEKFGLNCSLATDVAMGIPTETDHNCKKKERLLNIGINISGLLYNNGYTGGNEFGLKMDYKKFIKKLILAILEMENARIHLVPHVLTKKMLIEDDSNVSESIVEDLKANLIQTQVNRLLIAPRFSNPNEAINYIGEMDFFIGSRMHSTIAALNNCIPVIPVSYSKKFKDLFCNLGYEHVINAKNVEANDAVEQIMLFIEEINDLREQVLTSKKKATIFLRSYKKNLSKLLFL